MKLVISPAKSLNFESQLPTGFSSEACFLNEAEQLNALLKNQSPKALSGLMHISPCLLYTSPSPRDRYISRMPSSA